MSASKRAVSQKSASQAEVIIAYQDTVPAEAAIPAMEKVVLASQAAEERVDQVQVTLADVQQETSLDLAQLAEEFHAQSLAFAGQQSDGAVLLAQASQGASDDGVGAAEKGSDDAAGDLATDDGGLGGGGWAALLGLGVLAAAGGGGGGGAANTSVFGNGPTTVGFNDLGTMLKVPPGQGGGDFNSVIDLRTNPLYSFGNDDHIVTSGYTYDLRNSNVSELLDDSYTSWNGVLAEGTYTVVRGNYNPNNKQFDYTDGTGNDYLVIWNPIDGLNNPDLYGFVISDISTVPVPLGTLGGLLIIA